MTEWCSLYVSLFADLSQSLFVNRKRMDDLRQFYVLSNSASVISGRWADDNERLCTMKSRLRLKRWSPQAGLELMTARSVGQRLTR